MLGLTVRAQLLGLRLQQGYRRRMSALRDPAGRDRGDIVQTVIITAVLAACAIAVLAIIVTKVNNWGNSVPDSNTNPVPPAGG